jgi:hypothetical protein
MEYDWFYLESLATNFIFRASNRSSSVTGDAGDMVNHDAVSRVNGSPFSTTYRCATRAGPWWYSGDNSCCYSRLFGSFGASQGVFWNGIGNLKAARMMIRVFQ